MGYQRSDYGYRSDERWRDRDGYRDDRRNWRSGYDEDRGFVDRAGDEVRSWFGDEDAERRREMDQRRYEAERARYGGDYGRERERSYGGGWRNEDRSRRFDRIDAGSTGTHAAHPMSAPVGGGYGPGTPGYRSAARYADVYGRGDRSRGGSHDPNYSEWRDRQIEALDRDYDDYRREHQSKFDLEFGGWRERRQSQRRLLGRVTEHMDVVGSDGEHIGTVDKVRGDRIILTKGDPDAGGHHHSVPCSWVDKVEDKVIVDKTAEEARKAWRDEETSRALFEREDRGSEGSHVLGRSFSGTY